MSKIIVTPEMLAKFKTSFMAAVMKHEDGAHAIKNGHKLSFDVINDDIIFIQDNLTESEIAFQAVRDVEIAEEDDSETWVAGEIGFYVDYGKFHESTYFGWNDLGFERMAGTFIDVEAEGGYWSGPDADDYIGDSVKKYKDQQAKKNTEKPKEVPCVMCYLIVGIALTFLALAIF